MPAARTLGLSRRARRRGLLGLLAVLLLALVLDASTLWRASRWNGLIREGRVLAVLGPEAARVPQELPAALRFAIAGEQAARGQGEAALDGWRALQSEDSALGRAARFNAANALLREAERLRAGQQPGQAIALVELAKENLRELLRQDPGHWAARYNLERAQRLQPDADPADIAPAAAPQNAERAATTMRGVAQGLP
ncbi:MxaK protein [Azohydromonas caseinilytica]|uniref:MxaK protein n=1 Tax=Azohydromonas caseinilytica TaxID=2728836 RepID=A0A848FGI0_9BURK|nr:MxaK protein [Azohydromonas caseinilytica]NML17409.1 MxaK protein [Azohydromonas caseinilytica]